MKSRHLPPVILLFAAFGLFAASGLSQQDGSLPLFDEPTQDEANTFKRAPVQEEELPLFEEPRAQKEEQLILSGEDLQSDKVPVFRKPVPVAEEAEHFPAAEAADDGLAIGTGGDDLSQFGAVSEPAQISAAPGAESDLIREKYLQLAAERASLMNTDEIAAEVEKTELQIVELKARKGVSEAIAILAEIDHKYPGTLAAKQARAMIAAYSDSQPDAEEEQAKQRFQEVGRYLSGEKDTGVRKVRTEGSQRAVAEDNEESMIEIRRVSGFEDFPEPSLTQ